MTDSRPPPQRVRVGRNVQVFGQPRAGLAAPRETDGTVGGGPPGRAAGVSVEQCGDAFAKDGPRATGVNATEAADDEAPGDGPILTGEVGDGTAVVAVDAVGQRAAAGARSRGGGGDEQDNGCVLGEDEIIEA